MPERRRDCAKLPIRSNLRVRRYEELVAQLDGSEAGLKLNHRTFSLRGTFSLPPTAGAEVNLILNFRDTDSAAHQRLRGTVFKRRWSVRLRRRCRARWARPAGIDL